MRPARADDSAYPFETSASAGGIPRYGVPRQPADAAPHGYVRAQQRPQDPTTTVAHQGSERHGPVWEEVLEEYRGSNVSIDVLGETHSVNPATVWRQLMKRLPDQSPSCVRCRPVQRRSRLEARAWDCTTHARAEGRMPMVTQPDPTSFSACVTLRDGRWRLEIQDLSQPEGADEQVRTPISCDLEPDMPGTFPERFSQKLVGAGYVLNPAASWRAGRCGMWHLDDHSYDQYVEPRETARPPFSPLGS